MPLKSTLIPAVAAATLATSTTTANAHIYRDYGHCVDVTYDPIGCGLIIMFGVADLNIPDGLGATEKDRDQVSAMIKKGTIKKLEAQFKELARTELGQSFKGKKVTRTRSVGATLEMLNKGQKLGAILGESTR